MKSEHTFILYTKIHSKWLKDLNIRHGTIKVLEENRQNILIINHTNVFLAQSPKAIEIKAKINKWDNQIYKLLQREGNHKQNEKTSYRLRDDIYKLCD